ncbi:DsbA family oxidoreductase [Ectobacillus panaciterrae]|uniref:DsbA family oxidoreductase n=1 Tax=Ectobacillus panaciterrae TaxID=363872 RepID=UPI0004124CC0|nr:DsbA family oxidoreductase [Ectobacillus panaciterrae]
MEKIKVYSDFVCPFCFLGKKPIEEALKADEVEWMPFELRPEGAEPLDPNAPYIQNGWKYGVQPMAEKLGISMILPDIHPHPRTTLAHEGYQYAKEHGKGNEYVQNVFVSFWQKGLNIGDIEVLSSIAQETGLEKEAFEEALRTRKYKEAHIKALQAASHITAVPTMEMGSAVLQGVQSAERVQSFIKQQSVTEGSACSIDEC